jgi:thiosulfate reductase cytochrome b subunit
MSNKQIRTITRWIHIIGGAMIAAFVYASPLRDSDTFTLLMQLVVIPLLIVSGVVMWQQPKILKWLRGRS